MIRRRSTISIHDYPEHLNPFREERRESIGNKFRSFGQRGSSFRNAWNFLLPHSKRSQSFSRGSSSSPQPGCDTWTIGRTPRPQHEAIGLPASWTISPRRRYTPPNSLAGSPPHSPSRRGSQISVATLGTDVPSPDDRFHWQGARPKKRRAPLPPTSPTGSSATSSHSSSTASLRDPRPLDVAKDGERETLQVLVSRIQQEFGEKPKLSRHDKIDDKKGKEPGESVQGTTTCGATRAENSSFQVDRAFVVEPRVCSTQTSGDVAEESNIETNESETTATAVQQSVADNGRNTKQEDSKAGDDPPTTKNDAAVHEQQVAANVFVETTSRTISSNCSNITIAFSNDDKRSSTPDLENGVQIREALSVVTKLPETQASSCEFNQNINNGQIGDKFETDISVISEATKFSPCEIPTSECQVETVSGRHECGAFIVSTPDTASVYEDAASDEDIEVHEVKTTLSDVIYKTTLQEVNAVDSKNIIVDASVKSVNNGAHHQTKSSDLQNEISLTVASDDAAPSATDPSDNLTSKTCATITPRDPIPENNISVTAIDPKTPQMDASSNQLSIQRAPNNSLEYQEQAISAAPSSDSSFKVISKNDKSYMEATHGNKSEVMPRKDISTRTNGDILRVPITAPRNKSSNGVPEKASSTAKIVSPAGSSAATPTPPPRNKPQPVPRMKRLRKLFSN